jgi:cell division protein FtsL
LAKTFGTTTAKMSAFLIIAALVVTAIVAIVNAFKKFGEARKLSTQIDAVNEKISKLGDAAEEAKNKINDIAESRKEFDDMKKSFDGLVKGTKEWRE